MFHFTALWYINVLEKHFQRSRHLYSRQELGDLTATDRAEDRFLSECSRDCIPVPSLLSIIVISSKKNVFLIYQIHIFTYLRLGPVHFLALGISYICSHG